LTAAVRANRSGEATHGYQLLADDTAQEYGRGCRIAQLADEITNGRFSQISLH
jgi:hypothetical protein